LTETDLALRGRPAGDRLGAFLDAELVRGPQITGGEEHLLGALLGDRGRRRDEVVAAREHAGISVEKLTLSNVISRPPAPRPR
jgi:hypothetical protein